MKTFRLGLIDLLRLRKLAEKKERSESDIVREAIKAMAEREGIKVK